MPEFILDTAGQVAAPASAKLWPHPLKWAQLSEFVQGYIEALFFTENEPGTTCEDRMTTRGTVRKSWAHGAREGHHHDMPGDYGFADLAPESLLAILNDCREFTESDTWKDCQFAADEVADEERILGPARTFPDDAQAGRDFWYTRNGHGCGFWDGDWPAPYDVSLTAMAKAFGESAVYLGDDGLVYLA